MEIASFVKLVFRLFHFTVEKRFKTSPFAWSNPLSGYSVVMVKMDGASNANNGDDHYQMKLVRNKEDPFYASKSGSSGEDGKQNAYVVKWIPQNGDY